MITRFTISSLQAKLKELLTMSNFNFANDILKSLELNSINGIFIPLPYIYSNSCFRYGKKLNGSTIKYVNIVSSSIKKPYPHCRCFNRHEKGIKKIFLAHTSNMHLITKLEVTYRRHKCKEYGQYL